VSAPPASPAPSEAAVAAIEAVFAALDWRTLGRVYCDHGGDAFWEDRRRPAIDLGLRWAREAGRRLRRGGTSVYAGAGVAELPVMIHEALDLGRTVLAANLRERECAVLDRALAACGLPLRVVHGDARTIEAPRDHVALVSVLSDPETWPTLSGLGYGRLHPALVEPARLQREQEEARALVAGLLDRLTLPGLVTTTVEEVPWVLAWADARGVDARADDTMVDTAIVGDPIGFLRLRRAPSDASERAPRARRTRRGRRE